MIQWQHPAQQLSSEMVMSMQDRRPLRDALTARVTAWREAFRALLASWHGGHCPVFYLVGAPCQAGGKASAAQQQQAGRFTAVFCATGMMGCPSVHAVMSRTSRQFRAGLESAGVSFSMPLAATPAAGAAAQPPEQQHLAQGALVQGPGSGVQDYAPPSLVLVQGRCNVQGLYQALLQQPWCQQGQQDVPLLLSPLLFSGGGLSMLSFKVGAALLLTGQCAKLVFAGWRCSMRCSPLSPCSLTRRVPWLVMRRRCFRM